MVEERFEVAEPKSGLSRRTVMKGAAWTVPALMVATAAPAQALSCINGTFAMQGRGRLLNGQLLGLNLDDESNLQLAAIQGAHAEVPPGTTDTAGGLLDVTVLNALTLPLSPVGAVVSDVLALAAPAPAGVYNEYAWAYEGGASTIPPAKFAPADGAEAIGASGTVSDSGDVNLHGGEPTFPTFATIDLESILNNSTVLNNAITGPLVQPLFAATTGVNALSLEVGAVAGRAFRKMNCVPGTDPSGGFGNLQREYLVAGLKATATPGQASLLDGVLSALTGIQANVNIDTGALLSAILGALGGLADLISAVASASITLTIDTSYLNTPIPHDPNSALRLDLGATPKTITFDLASAAGVGYAPGANPPYLNTMAPNTKLFVDTSIKTATDATTSLVDGLVTGLLLDWLGEAVTVNALVEGLLGADILRVTGSLSDLLTGNATVQVLGILPPLTDAVQDAVALAVGNIVEGALETTLNTALAPVHTLLGVVFTALVQVLKVRLNAQNVPAANNNPSTGAGFGDPVAWADLAPTGSVRERYDVAALHLSVLELPQVLDVFLARGSVGPLSAT